MLKPILSLIVLITLLANPCSAQMKAGAEMQNYQSVFGLSDQPAQYKVAYLGCDSPANILYPGEQPQFHFRILNTSSQPLTVDGKADLIPFGSRAIPGDIWLPSLYVSGPTTSTPVHIDIPAGKSEDITLQIPVPEQMGGYGIVLDFGTNGRQFGTSVARTFREDIGAVQYPKMSLDDQVGAEALDRLGIRATRAQWSFNPTNADGWKELDEKMKSFAAKHVTVLLLFQGGNEQPLGRFNRHWLGEDDVELDSGGNGDCVWLPEKDDEFQKSVTDICAKYGWPRGPITGVSLFNEPWEGCSIAGWGSDIIRYRTIFERMALGVEAARKQGTNVLITGCDSSTNTWDKLFPDGKDTFLKWLDACTIHYQGLFAPSLFKPWVNRKGPNGRVKIWDTESWVANTDDRVATVEATNRAAGYDRSMGIYGGNVDTEIDTPALPTDASQKPTVAYHAWPLAASVGASQHFLGEREFKGFLFSKGLPWIFTFDGLNGNADDGSVVIAGDLGEVMGANAFPFRSVRGLKELQHKEDIRAKLAALTPTDPQRSALEQSLDVPEVLSGGMLSLSAADFIKAYDFYGNPVAPVDGQFHIPLDFRGYYLRSDGSPGSFAKLLEALKTARVEGYEPLDIVCHDAVQPLDKGGTFKLTLSNILNRPVQGSLQVTSPGLTTDAPSTVSFAPFETKEIDLKIAGPARSDNAYAFRVAFDAGADGKAIHEETLHANVIAKRTIAIDGKLDDWSGVLPQGVVAKGTGAPTLAESAWLPFKHFETGLKNGVATAYLAYDAHYFYFAAKIADSTPSPGVFRFAHLDADQFFYPEISYMIDRNAHLDAQQTDWKPPVDTNALKAANDGSTNRLAKIWTNSTVPGLGFIVHTQRDQASQVTLALVSPPKAKGGMAIAVVDRDSGKTLLSQQIPLSPEGVYAAISVKGRVHITVRGAQGKVGVAGVFLDDSTVSQSANESSASFVGFDSDTHGDWPAKYGKLGHWLPDGHAEFAAHAAIEAGPLLECHWPKGVRRYTYRKDVFLPAGNSPNFDNVQIAFNVLPEKDKLTLPNPSTTMPTFVPGLDSDYEFALNKVAPEYGGGTEIWPLRLPGMPPKCFYPRQPKSPQEGPITDGKLVVTQDANTRIVELALPWKDIPEVKAAADAGTPIKFSFRVNDDHGVGMELAENRSVSKLTPFTFHAEWVKHWSNEIQFGFEK